jgi:hypothetical protein
MLTFYNFNRPKWLGSNQMPKQKKHAPYHATGAHTLLDAAVRACIAMNASISVNNNCKY